MTTDVRANTFPEDYKDAIAMLWLENQDLSGRTPSEILKMYKKALEELETANKKYITKTKP